MTETAGDIIRDAYMEILQSGDDTPLEASEMRTGIRYLNRLMGRLAASGYNLGFKTVSNPADVLTVPIGAIDGIVSNLALSLSSQFPESGITESLATKARLGMNAIRLIGAPVIPTKYPSTLPIGSGNQNGSGGVRDRFYDEPK